ncbi:MAG TPA: P1 family peptidase [Acidimicrobiales bacterium]
MITDVPGLRVGHWTDARAATGCTVVLFPGTAVASGEVRGGAPASRDIELLDPGRAVERIDAVVLTGGSAFGLAAADGVMRFCEEAGVGVETPAGRVPIVPTLALYDLGVGDATVRPGAEAGYAACRAATDGPVELGRVGAGTGATVGTGTPGERRPGGLVSAAAAVGDLRVAALVAVNAAGTPGAPDENARHAPPGPRAGWGLNTTIGLVATNARLDKLGCHRLAQGAHDGLARAVFPAHTRYDGDAFVAASVRTDGGGVEADVDTVRALTVHAVAEAIRSLSGPS